MGKRPPIQIYCDLAFKLRNRIEFAETLLEAKAPTSQVIESVCMQGRKAIETIAYMALVATDHSLGTLRIPRDARKNWNAEQVFKRLKRKKLEILPSPSKMLKSDDPRFHHIFAGVPECMLTHDDLIQMYRNFHKGLHEPNPYVQSDESKFYKDLMPLIREDIAKLRKFVWVHFIAIKGEGFAVDLKNTYGRTVVVPLSRTGDAPPDYEAILGRLN